MEYVDRMTKYRRKQILFEFNALIATVVAAAVMFFLDSLCKYAALLISMILFGLLFYMMIFEVNRPDLKITDSGITYSDRRPFRDIGKRDLDYSIPYSEMQTVSINGAQIITITRKYGDPVYLFPSEFDNFDMVLKVFLYNARSNNVVLYDGRILF